MKNLPMKTYNRKVPTIIAVITLLFGVMAGIVLIQRQQSLQTSASIEKSPYNVTVSNIKEDSFTVSWTTDEPTVGFLLWGKGENPITPAQSVGGGTKEVHMVKVTNLEPDVEYSFTITSAGREYKNGTTPWTVRTGGSLEFPSTTKVMSGVVQTPDGKPLPQAVVVVSGQNMSPLSAISSSTGTWVVPLSLARTADLEKYVEISGNIVEIEVYGGAQARAKATVKDNAIGLLPPIIIGQSHNFTELETIADNPAPKAELSLPRSDVQGISDSSLVTLESVDNGEVVFTNTPEFFGSGPIGSQIEITVHSDEVSGETKIDQSGEWSWSPSQALENGLHNITVKWTDSLGIIHTLTRSFIVQAQEDEPSFESTPTATLRPTSTPTATPKPTASPTPTVKPTATPLSAASPASSPTNTQGLPDAGNATYSVLLGAVGFVTLSLGAIIALKNR